MARTKMVGAAIAVAAVFTGTAATPAHAETHVCEAAFSDPTLAFVCDLALTEVCNFFPTLPVCR